jgi:hypothetical protein
MATEAVGGLFEPVYSLVCEMLRSTFSATHEPPRTIHHCYRSPDRPCCSLTSSTIWPSRVLTDSSLG